jgi:hypothetical protein
MLRPVPACWQSAPQRLTMGRPQGTESVLMAHEVEQKEMGRQSVSPSQPSKAPSFQRSAPRRDGVH